MVERPSAAGGEVKEAPQPALHLSTRPLHEVAYVRVYQMPQAQHLSVMMTLRPRLSLRLLRKL
ncbi:MAG: hypothetical protein QW587_07550 [Candidatus Bathyarchaeia archaeon]